MANIYLVGDKGSFTWLASRRRFGKNHKLINGGSQQELLKKVSVKNKNRIRESTIVPVWKSNSGTIIKSFAIKLSVYGWVEATPKFSVFSTISSSSSALLAGNLPTYSSSPLRGGDTASARNTPAPLRGQYSELQGRQITTYPIQGNRLSCKDEACPVPPLRDPVYWVVP